MSMYEKKHALYLDYVREQESLLRIPEPISDDVVWNVCESYINSKDFKWINLFDDNNEVCGFVIVDKTYALANDRTVLVQQAYVIPENRKRGIVKQSVLDYIAEHSDKYNTYHIATNHTIEDFCPKKLL